MSDVQTTSFLTIYDSFLTRVTDDLYMELTELDTFLMLQDLLIAAIPRFEFPRFDIFDYEEGCLDSSETYCGVESNNVEVPATMWVGGIFNAKLTQEEINILALAMVTEWLEQQLAITKNAQLMFSGPDFNFTSQANHMAKLKVLIDQSKTDSLHMQRLYKRRIFKDGKALSTMGQVMTTPGYGYNI